MNDSGHTIILGAGPAGMAASWELSRADRNVLVIECASQVGGLAKTYVYNEPDGTYRVDNGPHRFFSKNKYLYDMIGDLLGEKWIQVSRLTRFFVDGKFYYYPVRFRNILGQMGLLKANKMIRDYGIERVKGKMRKKIPKNFEDFVVARFGRTLAEFNMINYTEKIWGIPAKEISVDWANQRIAGLSMWAALRKMLIKSGGPKSLVDTFYYPSLGSGLVYETMSKKIQERGSEVKLNAEPVKIRHENGKIISVDIKTNDGVQTFSPDSVISSIPITRCIELFEPSAPEEVRNAASKLKFRAQVYLFLTIDKEKVTDDNWVYFPDKEIPFGRITEMKNFSKEMCPEGKTSLFIEFFCFEGDEIWNADKERLFDIAMEWLEKLNFLKREQVLNIHMIKEPDAYPIYNLEYSENVKKLTDWVDSFDNLFAIGRPGRFRYTNQDHSLEMGILAAQSVLEGNRYKVDSVGSGSEYFERGYVPDKDCHGESVEP
jgi:protoporphyrinogen oxidase